MDYGSFSTVLAPPAALDLRFGIVYAARVRNAPFVGYRAIEIAPDSFIIEGFHSDGTTIGLFRTSNLFELRERFAIHLEIHGSTDLEYVRTDVQLGAF